jgi:hypothetical protein
MNVSVIWRNPATGKDFKTENTNSPCILEIYYNGVLLATWRTPLETTQP